MLNPLKLNPKYESRVFGLDIMRFMAIVFVVMGHGGRMLGIAKTNFPWIKLIDGVELFFVLSGFLIGGILIKLFVDSDSVKPKKIFVFWKRRWFRTLPMYYIILLIHYIGVQSELIGGDIKQFSWKFLIFLHNFDAPFHSFFWESWSLSIEEWFYLLFPIILTLLYLLFKVFKIPRKIVFLIATLLFLSFSLFLRWHTASKFQVDFFWYYTSINNVVIYHFDGIALGILGAFLKRYLPAYWSKYRYIALVFGLFISYFLLYSEWEPNANSTKIFRILFIAVGCFLLLPFFDGIKKGPKFFVKPITHISLISYSMYLINMTLVSESIKMYLKPTSEFTAYMTYFLYWSIVILVSTLLYKYIEKPILDLRDKI